MSDWEWEDTFLALLAAMLLSFLALGLVAIAQPHNVDYYYLSQSGKSTPGYCVQAHWTWHQDETAFCSDDYNKALDFAVKANGIVKDRR